MQDNVKKANEVKAQTLLNKLEKRFIKGFYCKSKSSAIHKIIELLEEDVTISWGGSATLDELGIKSIIQDKGYRVIDRDSAENPIERKELMRQAFFSSTYLTSTNAITMDGELVNIDGNGNRVAAISYGPDSVIVVAGMNKIVHDVPSAIQRIKLDACVPNAIRFDLQTPCANFGICSNCLCMDCMCAQLVVTRFSKTPWRIKVILVDDTLGF